VVKAALERRMDKVRNIEVTSETRLYSRTWLDGKLGERTQDGGCWQFHTLHRDGSYRVKSTWFVTQSATVADSTSLSHHDEKTGMTRILNQQTKNKGFQGRIGTEHLGSMHSNRVAFHLLGGSFVNPPAIDKCHFLLQSLINCSNTWSVAVDNQRAVISHPYRIGFVEDGPPGLRKVYFDIEKGMMPLRIEIDYSATPETLPGLSQPISRQERIVLSEPKSFDGFWMPTLIEEHLRTLAKPNECQVFLTKVNNVRFGVVADSDLQVKFPADTDVADTIKKVFYRTGPDGEPKGQVLPIGVPKGTLKRDEKGNILP
jgi:hypothetical protein